MVQPLEVYQCGLEISKTTSNLGLNAAVGYLSGFVFSIDPVGGAIVGVASALTQVLFDQLFGVPDNLSSKIALYVLFFFASAMLGFIATEIAGYPIPFDAALTLAVGMLLVSVSVGILYGCCCCFGVK